MPKFNTGNPVGSADPRDLSDSAQVADELINGEGSAYRDRLGKSRKSWAGVESQAAQQASEFSADQASRDTAFSNFLNSSGFEYLGAYAAGIEFTEYNQYVVDGGEAWFISPSQALPYTTSGTGVPESGALMTRGEALLRQEIGSGVVRADSLANLEATAGRFDGDAVRLVSGTGRDDDFRWNASDLSSTLILSSVTSTSVDSGTDTITSAGHGLENGVGGIVTTSVNGLSVNQVYWVINATTDTFQISANPGGSAFDLTGTTNFTFQSLLDPLKGVWVTPTSDLSGASGAWVRKFGQSVILNGGNVMPQWFGAQADGSTNDTWALQSAINFAARTNRYFVDMGLGHYLVDTIYTYYDSAGNSGFPSGDYEEGRISLIGKKAQDLPSIRFTSKRFGTIVETQSSTGSAIVAGSGASAGATTCRRVEIKNMAIIGSTSGDVLDINGAPQFSEFDNLTVQNTGNGGNAIHVRNGSYVSRFSNIHCEASGANGTEIGFYAEDGNLNVYSNITSTDCGGTAMVFGTAAGVFGYASVFSNIQARASLNGVHFRGGNGISINGLWCEQNTGDFDLKISHSLDGIEISAMLLASSSLNLSSCVLGDNTGDPAVDSCRGIRFVTPVFYFVGPSGQSDGLLKYADCTDLTLENPAFKNNGGNGIVIDESSVTKTRVINPNWFQADASSELGAAKRVVRLSDKSDARYLADVDGEIYSVTGIAGVSITNAVDSGTGEIRITATSHGYSAGDLVYIRGVSGTTEANGDWVIAVIDADTFDLDGSTFTNTYTSGGTSTKYALDMRDWRRFPKLLQTNTISGDVAICLPTNPESLGKFIDAYKGFAANRLRFWSFGGSISGSDAVEVTAAGSEITLKHFEDDIWKLL